MGLSTYGAVFTVLLSVIFSTFVIIYTEVTTIHADEETGTLIAGIADAPAQIHLYCDYLDTDCAYWHQDVLGMADEEYFSQDKASLTYFSRPGSEPAAMAAFAAECAGNQGYFTSYHDVLYREYGIPSKEPSLKELISLAADVGLDEVEFLLCMDDYPEWDREKRRVPYFVIYGGDRPREFRGVAQIEYLRSEINTILDIAPDGEHLGYATSADPTVKYLRQQVEELEAAIADLTFENERLRATLALVNQTIILEPSTAPVAILLDKGLMPDEYEAAYAGIRAFNEKARIDRSGWLLEGVDIGDLRSDRDGTRAAQIIREQGIGVGIGPGSDRATEIAARHIPETVLLGCCSRSPELANGDDRIYRLLPDRSAPGRALGDLMVSDGVRAAVGLYGVHDDDAVFDGVASSTDIVSSAFTYEDSPKSASAVVPNVESEVIELLDRYSATEIAVFYIGEDPRTVLEAASNLPALTGVRWYGSSGLGVPSDGTGVILNGLEYAAISSEMAGIPAETESVHHEIESLQGRAAYDAAWVAGLTITGTDSQEPADIDFHIHLAISRHDGFALGDISLDYNGDHAGLSYEPIRYSGGGQQETE